MLVGRRSADRVPDYPEVADRVATDLDTERRAGALDRIYATVRDAYEVEIEPVAPERPRHPIHRHSHADMHSHDERTRA